MPQRSRISQARQARNDLLQKFNPFFGQARSDTGNAGNIPAGACIARDQTLPDGIIIGVRHDNRYGAGRRLGGMGRGDTDGNDAVESEPDQLFDFPGKPAAPPICMTPFNGDVLAFDIPELAQPLSERLYLVALYVR